MNINDDLDALDPTEDDILTAEVEDDEPEVEVDDFDLDFDSNYRDDRYDTDGVPSWSAWA